VNAIHQLISPRGLYLVAEKAAPVFAVGAFLCLLFGLIYGLAVAPADYQQGDGFRIIYVHVPSAFLSLFVYVVMASASAVFLIWRIKLADVIAQACAPLGATFTFIALLTGAIWGKPMWGTWWVWDARLTSELILFFLYLGYISLRHALGISLQASRACSVLAVVGVVNIPIIHYSVVWWNTLHQGATLSRFAAPAIETSMLIPLLVMLVGFGLFFGLCLSIRVRSILLLREKNSQWIIQRFK
jgi:heme exporter protein C